MGVIKELKQSYHEPDDVGDLATSPLPKLAKSSGVCQSEHPQKGSRKFSAQRSPSVETETGELGITPPSNIQDNDDASDDLSEISNISENLVVEKYANLSTDVDREPKHESSCNMGQQLDTRLLQSSSLRPSLDSAHANAPTEEPVQVCSEQAFLQVAVSRRRRGLFSALRCCMTNDAVVIGANSANTQVPLS